jgi:hypothetical protein
MPKFKLPEEALKLPNGHGTQLPFEAIPQPFRYLPAMQVNSAQEEHVETPGKAAEVNK